MASTRNLFKLSHLLQASPVILRGVSPSISPAITRYTSSNNSALYIIGPLSRLSSTYRQPELNEKAMEELQPMKLPGNLSNWTGNVMYPSEQSAVWDVTRKWSLI